LVKADGAQQDPRQVVYNSFNGRFSDNPRAIYEELVRRNAEAMHVWTAEAATAAEFPREVMTVVRKTPEHLRQVDRSRYVVANVEMRDTLRKRDGVVFLQTWHGTPLKRIGYDNRYVKAHPGGFERDRLEYERWDYLISPNPWASEVLRGAFAGFDGEILETGWPRNDALLAPDRDEVRARVRHALGIEDGQTVVLYAPTWRDNLVHERGPEDQFSLALDIDEMARRLGDDHVLLLRLHFLVQKQLGDLGPVVRNVSAYPDVRDLYLAADVLITDYSSVMFDFAATGKPMLFYTYDLEHYRDELRGFYFDFEAEAPGPLCRTSDEVIAALEDIERVATSHSEAYARFRERHCPNDDGRASARVVERVFAELL
jgi:CDP-glycerol glycerophosphotransferase